MRIGFYAPLKAPDHPNPSGDRNIGRLLIKALTACGHEVEIISRLRSWDGKGSIQVQQCIQKKAQQEVTRLLSLDKVKTSFDLIFTYHVYHKAPDWIGVEIASALNIPYVIAEASYAPKQQDGPWHSGHQQTLKCISQAIMIIALNPVDIECLKPLINTEQSIDLIKPFLGETDIVVDRDAARKKLSREYKLNTEYVWLISVAMMRYGDKHKSYNQLASILKRLNTKNWHHLIIGDGHAYDEIKNNFYRPENPSIFLGKLASENIIECLTGCDVFVWPAVNEAFGLALVEAHACSLPAVVQNYGGVSTIVEQQVTGYITEPGDNDAFIAALVELIKNSGKRREMALHARKKFLTDHSFNAATKQLNRLLKQIR